MKRREIVSWAFMILIALLMGWAISRIASQLPAMSYLWQALRKGLWGWLGYSFCFFLANVIRSQRWRLMLGNHVSLSPIQAWYHFQWLFMLKSISPFRSGDLLRALWLKTRGGSGVYGAGIFIFERLTDLGILFLGALGVIYFFFSDRWSGVHSGVIFLLLLLLIVFVFFADRFRFIFQWLRRMTDTCSFTRRFISSGIQQLQRALIDELSPWKRMEVLFMTGLVWALIALGIGLALASLGLLPHWSASVALLVSTNFAAFISPLPANLGSYQFAGSSILLSYGILLKDAASVTIILHLLMLTQVALVGLLSMLLAHLSRKESS